MKGAQKTVLFSRFESVDSQLSFVHDISALAEAVGSLATSCLQLCEFYQSKVWVHDKTNSK